MPKEKLSDVIVPHHGVFRRQISFYEAMAMMSTVGAGILGIPFVIARVGLAIGVPYIAAVGLLTLGMNLLLGEISVRTGAPLQLVGMARKYLGKPGEAAMSVITYTILLGVLTVYIIGSGQALAAIFGGTDLSWSILFFCGVSLLVFFGLRTVKVIELALILLTLLVVFIMAAVSLPHWQLTGSLPHTWADIFSPYGVLLFAFHGTTSVPEAYALLQHREKQFHRAIVYSMLFAIGLYVLFAVLVVGVTGAATTELATIGLGKAIGLNVFILGNIFAILAMGMSFLMAGVSLIDSLRWDFRWPTLRAWLFVCGVPFVVFMLGLRGFISTINLIGGVLATAEMALILAIYWRARRVHNFSAKPYGLHHAIPLLLAVLLALLGGAVYSVWKLF